MRSYKWQANNIAAGSEQQKTMKYSTSISLNFPVVPSHLLTCQEIWFPKPHWRISWLPPAWSKPCLSACHILEGKASNQLKLKLNKPKVTTPGLSSFEPKVNKSPLKLIPRKMTCDNGGNTQSRLSDSRWDSAQIQSNAMIQKHLKTISPCCLFEMAYSLGRYSISLSCDSPLIASHCTSIYEVKSWLASASGTATQVVEGTLQWEVVQVLKFKLLANQHSRIVRM